MDAAGVERLVDLDGGWGDGLRREIERWQEPLPGRVAVFAGLDYERWAADPRFGETEATRLREGVAAGARGLKVWKLLGLRARDPRGRLVAVDDARLDPLWAAAGELGVPVTIHVADPVAFFEPLDERNERWEELHAHPDWHFWPTRPPGRTDLDGFPPFDELIDGLEAVVVRHPGPPSSVPTWAAPPRTSPGSPTILERAPNFNVDLAARIASWDASRTPPAPSSSAGRTACCSARTWRPTPRGGPSTTGSSRPPTSRSPTTWTTTSRRPRVAGGSTGCIFPTTCSAASTTPTRRG